MLNNPNYFTGNPLDRASDKRKDETFVATQLAHEEARMAVFWRGQPLMTTPIEDATESFVLWLHPDSVSQFKGAGTPLFLGLKDATPYFALDVSASAPEAEIAPFSEMGVYGQLREFGLIFTTRRIGDPRPSRMADRLASAQSLLPAHRCPNEDR